MIILIKCMAKDCSIESIQQILPSSFFIRMREILAHRSSAESISGEVGKAVSEGTSSGPEMSVHLSIISHHARHNRAMKMNPLSATQSKIQKSLPNNI
ncbi:hypothetical protein CEXT_237971 [Caerostris extrusa]|uniref:Uncharacterized protein n=1 Tax=Caerostris extrusa TaxID=172846 RepID=A0AAV4NL15_CAEEX|nr:hypothetical protein CEXT_237971 [Caerostris extrusa]